jgi:hypothetical protein
MGCDIHVYLEKYTSVNEVNKWVNVDYWQINPNFGHYENEPEYELVSFFIGRNYELFGILAGVRSSEDPIADPRGLPEDVTDVTRREYDKWAGDVHTPTYYTLKELKDYLFYNSDNEEITETLKRFIEPMDRRFKDEFWIGVDDEKRYTIKENGFRVVFWFDN